MNKREARRLITQRVAAAARDIDDFGAYGPADRQRLRVARDQLIQELENRCGVGPTTHPPVPGQIELDYAESSTAHFEIDYDQAGLT